MRFGYFLSCEEYEPSQLLEQAIIAEDSGFECLWISDHFHPWNDEQGQSPFVWSLIGALSQVTTLPVTTAVTCPTVRINPVVIAQAAATSAVMLEGRFTLGVGSGEALNEHVLGDAWPSLDVRLEMLEEAIDVMRELWKGEFVNHRGKHYTVDTARLYTLPPDPPKIFVSGFGPKATDLAARVGDGYITTSPEIDLLDRFRKQSRGKPTQGGVKVAWAPTENEGAEHAHRLWANSGLPGELAQVLPSPRHFEQASALVTVEQTRGAVACGSDPDIHLAALMPYVEARFDDLYVANMGPHYAQMIRAFGSDILPVLRERSANQNSST